MLRNGSEKVAIKKLPRQALMSKTKTVVKNHNEVVAIRCSSASYHIWRIQTLSGSIPLQASGQDFHPSLLPVLRVFWPLPAMERALSITVMHEYVAKINGLLARDSRLNVGLVSLIWRKAFRWIWSGKTSKRTSTLNGTALLKCGAKLSFIQQKAGVKES